MPDKDVSLIEILAECATVSELCAFTCIAQRNAVLLPCIYLSNKCAEVCQQTVELLRINLVDVSSYLHTCEEILTLSLEECRKHSYVTYCGKCAKVCEKCLDACQKALKRFPIIPKHTSLVEELALLQ